MLKLCILFLNIIQSLRFSWDKKDMYWSSRNVFHMAASCGRCDVIKCLCDEQRSNWSKNILQSKDKESGWTPLHRAIYYGHIDCVVFLYKVKQLILLGLISSREIFRFVSGIKKWSVESIALPVQKINQFNFFVAFKLP